MMRLLHSFIHIDNGRHCQGEGEEEENDHLTRAPPETAMKGVQTLFPQVQLDSDRQTGRLKLIEFNHFQNE